MVHPLAGRSRLPEPCGRPRRTLFVFDVRSEEEFASGHLPGAVDVPVVQLVQATDQWIGVRRAHVILVDDTGDAVALPDPLTEDFINALAY